MIYFSSMEDGAAPETIEAEINSRFTENGPESLPGICRSKTGKK